MTPGRIEDVNDNMVSAAPHKARDVDLSKVTTMQFVNKACAWMYANS